MTKTHELLEAIRKKHESMTDYRLAKTLGIDRKTVSRYLKEKQDADAYAATRIAVELGRDPLEVIG